VQSAVNQVVSKRFVKKQQMRWTASRRPFAAANPGPSVERGLARHVVPVVPRHTFNARAEGGLAPVFFHSHPDPTSYAKKFSGKYTHRLIQGGVGHNLPQEAPQAFAQAVVDVASHAR
jgi:hypothetical protein